jgi:orotate phosphoribosyltransferase
MNEKKARLLELLTELSFARREVTLASGRTSNFYIDGKQTTLHPEGALLTGELCWEVLADTGIEAVGGPTLGADPIVTAIAIESQRRGQPVPAFIIRKQAKGHGTGQWIEGMKNLREGMRVAIVEDTMTTGGSGLKAVRHAEEAGLKVEIVLCICDRQEGAREAVEQAGYRFESLFTKADFMGDDQ